MVPVSSQDEMREDSSVAPIPPQAPQAPSVHVTMNRLQLHKCQMEACIEHWLSKVIVHLLKVIIE